MCFFKSSHKPLDVLQLVDGILHRCFGRCRPLVGSSFDATVLQYRAGLWAAGLGHLGPCRDAPRQASGEQVGAGVQRRGDVVRVEAEPRARAKEGTPPQCGGRAGRET